MKVWILKNYGMHYHITNECPAVNFKPSTYPKEDYEQVEWFEAVNNDFNPCPICHSDFDIVRVVKRVGITHTKKED